MPKNEKPSSDVAQIDELIAKSAKGGGVASEARTALGKLADAVVSGRFVVAVESANAKVRSVAVEGGTATPGRRALFPLGAILRCLADVEPKVRLSALLALNRGWGPKNDAVYAPQRGKIKPALAPLLNDENKPVASQAAIVWKRLGLRGESPSKALFA